MNFSLNQTSSSVVNSCAEGLEKTVGYADGFEKATQRFELMIFSSFGALTLHIVSATLLKYDKKLPGLDQESSDDLLFKIQDFTFHLSYGVVTIMFFTQLMGYGELQAQQVTQ